MKKYLAEVYSDGAIRRSITIDASHPHQAARRAASGIQYPFFAVYVLSEDGFGWEYLGKRTNGTILLQMTKRLQMPISKDSTHQAFAGNIKLYKVIK